MSATVAAALKKIAVALLSNKKGLKTVGGIILGIAIIILMPAAVQLAMFTGNIKLDTEGLYQQIESAYQNQMQNVEDRIMGITG